CSVFCLRTPQPPASTLFPYTTLFRSLSSDVRDALERLLGRALQEEETISVQTYPTHEAPTGSERDEAWRRLLERIDKTAARVANVPESELDALIDEIGRASCRERG